MLKKTAIAAALALTMAAVAPATTANAGGNVSFGVVIGDGHGNGFWIGNGNSGWGNPGWVAPAKMSCWEARQYVKSQGYKFVTKIECNGNVYRFKAKAGFVGPYVVVKVNAFNGNLWV